MDYLDAFKGRPFKRPSKVKLFEKYLDRRTYHYWFSDTRVKLLHRATVDQLIHIWNKEMMVTNQSSGIHGMDVMNLLASIHVALELKKLEIIITDLKEHLDQYEHRTPRRTSEETVYTQR